MGKILITQTNGASAEDISDAIGKYLEQNNNQAKPKKSKKSASKADPASGPKNK